MGLPLVNNAVSGTFDAQISDPGTYYLITTHGIGYDQATAQVTLHYRLDGTNSLYLALEALTLFPALVALAGFFIVRRRENRKTAFSLMKENPHYGLGEGKDDNRILQIVKGVCQDLRVKIDPVKVYYIVWIPFGGVRVAPSDQCGFGIKGPRLGWIELPAILRNKLSPTEWRPLIASSLV